MRLRVRSVCAWSAALALLPGVAASQAAVPPRPIVLELPASVRSAGMSGVGVAIVGDAGSVFLNPSGLATIKSLSVEAAYSRLPDRSIYTMGAAAVRIGQLNVGGGYQYLLFSDSSAVQDNLEVVGTLVYRFGLIALGTTGKYVSVEDTTGLVTRTLSADAGITLAVFDIMAFALSLQNLARDAIDGPTLDLPTTTRLGFALNFVDPQETARLLGTVEQVWTSGRPARTLVGGEVGAVFYGLGIVARIGYGPQPPGSGQSRMSYGGGVVLGRFRADYAYQRGNAFGRDVHRVGLRWTP